MAHPQTSPRGLWQKGAIKVGADGLFFAPYSETSALLDSNSTGLLINSTKALAANGTGYIFSTVAAKPAARSSSKVAFLRNSTGVNAVMVNTTGTTWKYLNVTTVLPT